MRALFALGAVLLLAACATPRVNLGFVDLQGFATTEVIGLRIYKPGETEAFGTLGVELEPMGEATCAAVGADPIYCGVGLVDRVIEAVGGD